MYYTYMLRCEDDTIYTGITTNLKRRFKEHVSKNQKCAKYTYHHSVIKMECAGESVDRGAATRFEYYIKRLKKEDKEDIITSTNSITEEVLLENLKPNVYKRLKNLDEYLR